MAILNSVSFTHLALVFEIFKRDIAFLQNPQRERFSAFFGHGILIRNWGYMVSGWDAKRALSKYDFV